jgi:hypothetical protein
MLLSFPHIPGMKTKLFCQIVEELEDRLGDRMEDILSDVKSSLASSPPITTNGIQQTESFGSHGPMDPGIYFDMDEESYVHDEIVFDDMGEGAGVEGDLDMDDD